MPRKLLLLIPLLALTASAQSMREFNFDYSFTVKNIAPGAKVRVWFPKAHSDQFQDVSVVSATGDLPLKTKRESRFGNEMFYAETNKAKQSELRFSVIYAVVRKQRVTLGSAIPHLTTLSLSNRERKEYLAPDALVPVTGLPADLAAKTVAGQATDLGKARAIYDYVFANMRYDKSGTGWGHGDVLYACSAKHGNCTDFHSLFIAMARSQGIPARFEIGFALPANKHKGEIPGYHCWAEFFEPQHGWIPVDISEAWKSPEKKDFYFGAQDANRVQFSMGRDLRLSPAQDGKPLNYFVYPYVEVNEKEDLDISNSFSFEDKGAFATR